MRTVILMFLLATGPLCIAQKKQFSFHLNSGLFSFGGASATDASFLNLNVSTLSGYTNNPYGTNSSFSWGFGVQAQKITKGNFICGVQLGYESLASKLTLDYAFGEVTMFSDEGETILTTNFLNIYPSIGQRFQLIKGIDTDLLAGFDLGLGISSIEEYQLTTNGIEVSGTNDRDEPNLDVRPRIELVNYFKNFGLSIGYSHGLTNYQPEMDGANIEVYSRYVRLGISYRLD